MPIIMLKSYYRQPISLSYTGTWTYVETSARKGYAILTSSGTLTVNTSVSCDVWAVGGGGGGGGSNNTAAGAAGGGGGGYNTLVSARNFAAGDYTVTVGGGGAAGTSTTNGSNGGASSIVKADFSTITANGGSGGVKAVGAGGNGGSGGGGGAGNLGSALGGNGGYNGSNGSAGASSGAAGGTGDTVNGTPFRETTWQTLSGYYGMGGVGGCYTGTSTYPAANAAQDTTERRGSCGVRNGATNTGCGGGGSSRTVNNGTDGGSGIICIRWDD